MKIEIKNIGIIKEAILEFDGIAVIGGYNDTGKSTVGKLANAIVNAYSKNDKDLEEYKSRSLRDIVRRFARTFERYFPDDFNEFMTQSSDQLSEMQDAVDNLKKKKPDQIERISELEIFLAQSTELNRLRIDKYKRINLQDELGFIFRFSPRTNVFSDDQSGTIDFTMSGLKLHLKLSNSSPAEIGETSDFNRFFEANSILIESPVEFHESIHNNSRMSIRPDVNDLFDEPKIKLLDELKKIMLGSFKKTERLFGNRPISSSDYAYKKETRKLIDSEFNLNMTATGLKSFGLLYELLKDDKINANTLLIMDEPEVHLHPNWQFEMARILIRISKDLKTSLIINSHSPYLIQGLEAYSQELNYSDYVRFYHANYVDNDGRELSTITDVTNDTSPLYASLQEPFPEYIRMMNKKHDR